jgi:hypothetical protein
MVIRLQILLWICMICIGSVVAQVPATLKFTLYHQLLHSNSAKDIVPRGVIKYDSTRNTALYQKQSEVVDLSSGKGIYRIGIYDANKKELSPAAFTKLVLAPHTTLTAGCCQRTSKGRDYAIPLTRERRLPHFLPPKTINNIRDTGQRHPLQTNPRRTRSKTQHPRRRKPKWSTPHRRSREDLYREILDLRTPTRSHPLDIRRRRRSRISISTHKCIITMTPYVGS